MYSTTTTTSASDSDEGRAMVLNWMSNLGAMFPPIDFESSPLDNGESASVDRDTLFQHNHTVMTTTTAGNLLEDALSTMLLLPWGDDFYLSPSRAGETETGDETTPRTITAAAAAIPTSSYEPDPVSPPPPDLRCWDHGCEGRLFTTLSNLKRHQREKSSGRALHPCPRCGAHFSRMTARNRHLQNQSCTRIRRNSNGRKRPCVDATVAPYLLHPHER
jgi:hypothetical protein